MADRSTAVDRTGCPPSGTDSCRARSIAVGEKRIVVVGKIVAGKTVAGAAYSKAVGNYNCL
jgi:hypothetical protein